MRHVVVTRTGELFDLADPQPEDIDIGDIAHALSQLCRYDGQTPHFYSVAQHSYHVSYLCEPQDALWGLLHDAAEAYIGDIVMPLRRMLSVSFQVELLRVESRIMRAICERFGLSPEMPRSVHAADRLIVQYEARDLWGIDAQAEWGCPVVELDDSLEIQPWCPPIACGHFHNRFIELADA